jgi:glutathione synthase/RimK-type ligase-like ATP-grasp enzyme
MRPIALVTARETGKLDDDMEPLIAALRAEGAQAEPAIWDDPSVDWGRYELAVLRSTWDYSRRRAEFLAWAESVESKVRLANSARVVAWNTDKHYMSQLRAFEIPIVPTAFIDPGHPVKFPFEGEFVVKPTVGAGSMDVGRYAERSRDAEEHVLRLHRSGRSAMIQPYLKRVDEAGETALIYFAGEFSHAIRKGPMLGASCEVLGGLFLKEDIRPREATPAERALGQRAVQASPERCLYARIDVIPGLDGAPVVLEFEATEPSLFFVHHPAAATRYAKAILNWTAHNSAAQIR